MSIDVLDIISPTRKVPYTVEYALNKSVVRNGGNGVYLEKPRYYNVYSSQYDDRDILVDTTVHLMQSQWTHSIIFTAYGRFPLHFSASQCLEPGFFCGDFYDTEEAEKLSTQFSIEFYLLDEESQVIHATELSQENIELMLKTVIGGIYNSECLRIYNNLEKF